ncbi:MAG: hypothetical protein ACTSPA_15615, partial [Promethearchaeota archaeon]
WTQIDWIKWMPVEIAVLLFLIILIRIIRRLTRWGSIKISHVREGLWDYNGMKYHTYFKSNSLETVEIAERTDRKSEKSQLNNRILLIPPLMDKIIKGNHLATAITMIGHDVVVLNHNNVQDFCKDQINRDNTKLDFEKFLLEGQFSTVIIFDWSIFPIFKLMGFYENQPYNKDLKNISWILIRPTLKWSDIESIWKIIPFTGIWFSKLRFLKFQIQPSKSWLSEDGEKNLINYQKNCLKISKNEIFQFSQGNWAFFRNETIVLGIIIQEILKKERKKHIN